MIEINCCILALIAFAGNIVQLVFFFNYSLKLKDKSVELSKRTGELEKKNGKELKRIEELEKEIKELKSKLSKNE